MIAFICSNNIIWDISLYPTKGYCVWGGIKIMFCLIQYVKFEILPYTTQKSYFVGTPWYASATLRMTIKDVISSLSRNLKRCLLSKFKGIIFVIIYKSEIPRLCSGWQEKSAVYSNTMQKYSAFIILRTRYKSTIKISRKCYVFGCYFLCKV